MIRLQLSHGSFGRILATFCGASLLALLAGLALYRLDYLDVGSVIFDCYENKRILTLGMYCVLAVGALLAFAILAAGRPQHDEPGPSNGLSGRDSLLLLSLLLALQLPGVWPVLTEDYLWDDIHLVRGYSCAELLSAFHGPWDPDNLETPAYRPLILPLYHSTYRALGERPVLYRLFSMLLFAAALTWTCRLASAHGRQALGFCIGAALFVLSDAHVALAGWPTEIFRSVSLLLAVAMVALLMAGARAMRFRPIIAAVALAVIGLLLREEMTVVIAGPVLLFGLFGGGLLTSAANPPQRRRSFAAVVIVAFWSSAAAYWILRAVMVGHPRAFNWGGPSFLLWQIAHTYPFRSMLSGMALIAALVLPERAGGFRPLILMLVGSAVVCASPAVTKARLDVGMFSTLFLSFAVGVACAKLLAFRGARAPLAILGAVSVFFGVVGNQTRAYDMRDLSIRTIRRNTEFIHGAYARSTIPAERRARFERRLAQLGIHGGRDRRAIGALERKALRDRRWRPDKTGLPFISRFDFVESYNVSPRPGMPGITIAQTP